MSRVGRRKIDIPSGVKVTIGEGSVRVEGPRGALEAPVPGRIRVELKGTEMFAHRDSEEKTVRALHGLTRALLANCVKGVTKGFQRELDVVGIGYRAEVKGNTLALALGFSHGIDFPIPKGIKISVDRAQKQLTNYVATILVEGNDKQQVGQVAANIRALRPPDPYKGKGVRYIEEVIKTKVGKRAV